MDSALQVYIKYRGMARGAHLGPGLRLALANVAHLLRLRHLQPHFGFCKANIIQKRMYHMHGTHNADLCHNQQPSLGLRTALVQLEACTAPAQHPPDVRSSCRATDREHNALAQCAGLMF